MLSAPFISLMLARSNDGASLALSELHLCIYPDINRSNGPDVILLDIRRRFVLYMCTQELGFRWWLLDLLVMCNVECV